MGHHSETSCLSCSLAPTGPAPRSHTRDTGWLNIWTFIRNRTNQPRTQDWEQQLPSFEASPSPDNIGGEADHTVLTYVYINHRDGFEGGKRNGILYLAEEATTGMEGAVKEKAHNLLLEQESCR